MKCKKELHKKKIKDLNIELLNLLREQFNIRMQKKTEQFKKTHLIKIVRRNIAKIKTIIREKLVYYDEK